ncbi:MAG TPA: ABC transporter substrate-binding protein, partial [Thermoanaerobaculia bacterium]|nr:ABC transporter substrate-binding protein [Thermoanaerobaculia bacterium]
AGRQHGAAPAPRPGPQAGAAATPAGSSASAAGAAALPRRGGTIVTGWTAEPVGVNELIAPATTAEQELTIQLFLRLVREDPNFERHPPTFSPALARSYEWSPDHKTLTFHLREDARWSDGVPVTAEDVRWTWQAQTSPDVAWAYSYMKAQIADVEAVDPHTVRVRFKRVYAKQMLDVNEGGILPRHAWAQVPFSRWRQSADWFKEHLVVDGPFTIASWKPKQELVLVRNRGYFDPDRPHLDRVVMRIIPDQASILAQLGSGELDFTPAFSPADAAQVAANPRLRLLAFPYRTWVAVAWNSLRSPFSDPEVRRALAMALDRPAIVETIWGKFASVGESPILSVVWAYDKALRPLPHDPAAARRILAAKGFAAGADGVLRRGGKPFAFEISTNAGNQQRVDALVMIQEQLRQIGVRAEPRQVEFNSLNQRLDAGDFDATVAGFSMDTSLDLTTPFHSREIGSTNLTHYSNPEVDRLIDHAMSQPDIALARPDLDRIQEILHHDQPYTFLWESQRLSGLNRRLHGVEPSMLYSFYDLKDWWVEPSTRR